MERQFNNGDFEKLLRDNANQYRMYPSEKVWKGIHSALHSRRRWYGLTIAILLLITGSVVSVLVSENNAGQQNITEQEIKPVNASQTRNPVLVTGEQKRITPALKQHEPARPRTIYLAESKLNNPVFNFTNTNDEQQVASLDFSERTYIDEKIDPNVSPISEILKEQEFSAGNNLRSQDNDKVKSGNAENNLVAEEKNINGQSTVDKETEKKINDAISALASQNVPVAAPQRRAKVTGQVFFTPTVSYRKLTENKNSGNNYFPAIGLNNLVNHKPAMGLEFGFEGRYQASKKLFIKTGLQFNISRYDIRAYSHPTEIATVALSNGNRVDSLATLSNYRNFNGTSPNWLENFYFQVGMPIGAEFILSDKNDLQWGVSGTIQPTYVIGDRAYVISSDYKNYAEFPDLIRRWNVSTGVGAFVSYSTGRIKWQAGPHVRYQHLSSFVSELSVKENIFAIGLKVGATLNK